MSGDAQMNVLQPHKWPAIADSGFWQGYYQQAIFHLLTHLLPHHPLPSSKCCCCCCCGGDCSLYVGADEILRASGELFKREDYESSFLARCWRVWIDMSPPQPQPFLSFFFSFFCLCSPWNHGPSKQKSRHMGRGPWQPGQPDVLCPMKYSRWESKQKQDGIVYLCVCVWACKRYRRV